MAKSRKLMPVAEDESYFVSMTDLMVGMLFIFIIMLMAFALNLREQEHKFDQTTTTLTKANETRRKMLEDIKQAMERRGVKVIVDAENGVLRLPEELLFARGEYELSEKGHDALHRLGDVLAQTLPCYADGPTLRGVACPPSHGGRLEAVFIEGHTDDRQIAGRMNDGIRSNWELSTARAIATFNALVQQAPSLAFIDNDSHLRILGVSGYAENRPVSREDTEEARASNRRINLRFLMATPNTEELNRIRQNVEMDFLGLRI
jgi:chemotaxis protein MotB